MKNKKLSMDQTAQKVNKSQLIDSLKQKNLKGGATCPPPWGKGG